MKRGWAWKPVRVSVTVAASKPPPFFFPSFYCSCKSEVFACSHYVLLLQTLTKLQRQNVQFIGMPATEIMLQAAGYHRVANGGKVTPSTGLLKAMLRVCNGGTEQRHFTVASLHSTATLSRIRDRPPQPETVRPYRSMLRQYAVSRFGLAVRR